MKNTISLCMIVRNESLSLARLLHPIKSLLDEIIIVDTGSKDNTKKIAGLFTKKVYSFPWCDDFSKARNFSIKKAAKDWVLILDPDEKISKQDLLKIKRIIASSKDAKTLGYRLIQKTHYGKKVISIRGICRLFKNHKKIKFIYPVHETVKESIKALGARIGKTGIVINHYPHITRAKEEYYLKLLKIKKAKFPGSKVDKEIENEIKLFNPR